MPNLSQHQKRLIMGVGLALALIIFVADLFNCDKRINLARFNLPQQRTILITGDYCWEVSRFLRYEIKENGRTIVPSSFLSMDNGFSNYEVVQAEGGALVGILKKLPPSPSELVLMHDFQTGKSWQIADAIAKPTQLEQRRIFERLRRENPQLPLPPNLPYPAN